MRIYRLSRKKYSAELSGKGAALAGNRWNSKGTEIIYTSESRALAMAEVAVHLTLATLPKDFVMLEIHVPDDLAIKRISAENLPFRWNVFPHSKKTQVFGDRFIRQRKYAILQVPSAVVPGDFNYLVHPFHADFKRIKIVSNVDFPVDKRIFE